MPGRLAARAPSRRRYSAAADRRFRLSREAEARQPDRALGERRDPGQGGTLDWDPPPRRLAACLFCGHNLGVPPFCWTPERLASDGRAGRMVSMSKTRPPYPEEFRREAGAIEPRSLGP